MKLNNKNTLTFLICIISFISISCQKEIFESEFKGTVKHYYTKQPISGISIKLTHGHGSSFYGSSETEGITTTDAEGKFSFNINKARGDAYMIEIVKNRGGDSTVNEWKYVSMGFYESIDNDVHPELLLKPAGDLAIYLSDNSWSILLADTFVIETVYAKDTLFRGKRKWKEFWIEPSQWNKFIWYGIKNKQKFYYEEKLVFAPNAYFNNVNGIVTYYTYGYWINL